MVPKNPYTKPEKGDEIVISGMAGYFPDSYNIYHFRDNLFNKVDMVSEDFRRWRPLHPEVPQRTGKIYNIEKFDSGFFGVTSSQCHNMEPMLRTLLERTFEAIIDAGYHPSDFENTQTGVFSGSCFSESEKSSYYESLIPFCDSITGTHRSLYSKRISYYLKLKAPSFILDTACSSSLFAFEQAYTALRDGLCEKAIVCGTNLCLHPLVSLQFSRLGVLSEDGSCKSFDAQGNGYARSEGIVVILLEKAKDAKRIYSEVVYAKVNCDGYKPEGITFPSSDAQKMLMKDFYNECKVNPALLTFAEAHGTGTRVGDPEELSTLETIFCTGRSGPLYIGAVKSNIGHNEPASGLCSVVKVIIGMEAGFIPPNRSYEKPIDSVTALKDGRMIVVTEKMPLPDQRGLFGVNSFGFGGANAHVLLHWNEKAKIKAGCPNDRLPRLICVSGRTKDGVNAILDDFQTRNCDAEFAYLIHQVFRKTIEHHLFRGYGIFNATASINRSVTGVRIDKEKFNLVISNFNKDVLKLGPALMEIPIFAGTIKSIQDILDETVDLNISDMTTNYREDNLIKQLLGTVAIQIGLANILKEIKLTPYRILGMGSGELVAAYLADFLTLKQTIMGLFYAASNLVKGNVGNWDGIENCFGNRKSSYGKWVPANAEILGQNCAKYFIGQIGSNSTERKLPKGAVPLIIGKIRDVSGDAVTLVNVDSKDYIVDLLNNLGSLYEKGFDMELNKLYPKIELPVSRGTPMLSPLIKWDYGVDRNVFYYKNEAEIKSGNRIMVVSVKEQDWRFIIGHAIDGRNLFPATGYLVLVWESLAITIGKLMTEMKVVFQDVKYIRAATVPKEGSLNLSVTIQTGKQEFAIVEGGATIVTGRVYELIDEDFTDLPNLSINDDDLCMDGKDVYKELRLRGYHYTGKFRSIKKCNVDVSRAVIEWDGNWIYFMDCILQLLLLQADTRNIFIPTSIGRLVIDGPKHLRSAARVNNALPVHLYKDLNIVRTGGIELRALGPSSIPRRKPADPVLEISKFIPNRTAMMAEDSIRSFVQIVLENVNIVRVKVVEVCTEDQTETDLICPLIQKTLEDLPLINQEITVIAAQNMDILGVTVLNKSLSTESKCLILIVTDILNNIEPNEAINAVKDVKGFIISKEDVNTDLSKFSQTPFKVICSHLNAKELLVLLRPRNESARNIQYIDVSKALDNLESWIPKLQNLLKQNQEVVIYAQDEELSGILGLTTCLKREPYGNRISCVFIMDDAPKFDPNLDFYKAQLDKNLAFNIWKDGAWGTYRHLVLPQARLVETEHAYANVTTKGDLSTMTWLQGPLNINDTISHEEGLVHIYYAALNFRDLMTASGRITAEVITEDRIQQECIQGFEFSGRTSNGERVLGMCVSGALATMVQCKLIMRIPNNWTMEDAATCFVVYATVYQILLKNNQVKRGQSILIHSGTGGIGLAAINLCLYYGLTVFVTVGTQEKRDFIKKNYPQIKEEHIGNSRDTSFEDMVHKYTGGRGVDYVLNSLAEEKLVASIRCLAKGGKFLEIGKFDLASNNILALQLLEKEAQFRALALDRFVLRGDYSVECYIDEIQELIKCGAIKPLPRTIFKSDEVEKAFRYIGTGKHIGKVLIKIRDEEPQEIHQVPQTLFKAVPRFLCKPECSYLICGGLGGFGLELADLLVVRGAKKLILTSRSGLCNGYQKYRIRIWESYGVTVITSTGDASTEEGCNELLNIAQKLGPLDGIFNLAAILKDAAFENLSVEDFKVPLVPKAVCTNNLDKISRRLCPNLRYFVVFSSISCGRGNLGQTNYGMANSIMERICEKRKKEGYPALAIQWGAVGEVGLVAKMQEDHRELVIGGTLQQRISSCLQVLDNFLMQDEPIVASMLVAEKRYGDHANNLFDAVLNIMGVTNLKSVSMHASFPELGMDSMTAVEIKQTLEREYEVFLTAQDIRGMTLSKLRDLANIQQTATQTIVSKKDDIPMEIKLLLNYMTNEESIVKPLVKLETLVREGEEAPHIFVIPGLDGTPAMLEPLCRNLKAHATCLTYPIQTRIQNIDEITEAILPYLQSATGDLIILAYSYGTVIATEVMHKLEAKGRTGKIIFIDGSPELIYEMVKAYFPTEDDSLFQTLLLSVLMSQYMAYEDIIKHQEVMMKLNSYLERIEYFIRISSRPETSLKYVTEMCLSNYDRLKALSKYKMRTEKLKSPVTLLKAKSVLITKATADYGLSKVFQDRIKIVTIEGNHVSILVTDELAEQINWCLEDVKLT